MNTTSQDTLRAQLFAARKSLRAAIDAYVAKPSDVTELTVATRGATVCAIEKKLDARHGALAAFLGQTP